MKYLRQKEVCDLLRISESAFTTLKHTTDFPRGIVLGNLDILLWIEDEIHEWVSKQKRKKTLWN